MSSHKRASPPRESYSVDHEILFAPLTQSGFDSDPPTDLTTGAGGWTGSRNAFQRPRYGSASFDSPWSPYVPREAASSSLHEETSSAAAILNNDFSVSSRVNRQRSRSYAGVVRASFASESEFGAIVDDASSDPGWGSHEGSPLIQCHSVDAHRDAPVADAVYFATFPSPTGRYARGQSPWAPRTAIESRAPATRHPNRFKASERAISLTPPGRDQKGRGLYMCPHPACRASLKTWSTRSALQKHQLSHMPESDRPHACQQCERRFLWPKDLRRHEETRHQPKIHFCMYCQKSFSRGNILERHMRAVHSWQEKEGRRPKAGTVAAPSLRSEPASQHHDVSPPREFWPIADTSRLRKTATPPTEDYRGVYHQRDARPSRHAPSKENSDDECEIVDSGTTLSDDALGARSPTPPIQPADRKLVEDEPSEGEISASGSSSTRSTSNALGRRLPKACQAGSCVCEPPNNPIVAAIVARLQELLVFAALAGDSEHDPVDQADSPAGPQTGKAQRIDAKRAKRKANGFSQSGRKRRRQVNGSSGNGEDEDGMNPPNKTTDGRPKSLTARYYFLCIFCEDAVGICRKSDGRLEWSRTSRFCDLLQHIRRDHCDRDGFLVPSLRPGATYRDLKREIEILPSKYRSPDCLKWRAMYQYLHTDVADEDIPDHLQDASVPPGLPNQVIRTLAMQAGSIITQQELIRTLFDRVAALEQQDRERMSPGTGTNTNQAPFPSLENAFETPDTDANGTTSSFSETSQASTFSASPAPRSDTSAEILSSGMPYQPTDVLYGMDDKHGANDEGQPTDSLSADWSLV